MSVENIEQWCDVGKERKKGGKNVKDVRVVAVADF